MRMTPRKISGADGSAKWVCVACGLSHPTQAKADSCCIARPASASARQEGGDHYKRMSVQPWDVVDTWPIAERIAYYRGNALKYLMRLNDKDTPEQNARKAEHYCQKLAETLGGK